jgi:hypothetical protein
MQEETVVVEDRIYRLIKEKGNRRTAQAVVKNSDIIITIPKSVGYFEADRLFRDLKGRILKKLQRRRKVYPGKSELFFMDKQVVGIRGREFNINVSDQSYRKTSTAKIYGDAVKIFLAKDLPVANRNEHISRLARSAISKVLMPELVSRINDINSAHFNSELGRVRFKDNMTNWGSISKRNNINIDFRLFFAPVEIMDAIIYHELAHTKHRNHSKAFYDLLLGIMPDYKERLRWLRENADKLRPGGLPLSYNNPNVG